MNKAVVVVGSLNLDFVAHLPRMPIAGETVMGTSFATYPGGKGANQAVAVARLGGEVYMVGMLGQDLFATQLKSDLADAGVNTTHVQNVPGESGSAMILVTADGTNSIIVNGAANSKLLPERLEPCRELLMHAAVILSQLEIPLHTVIRVGEMAQSAGVPFILDPAPAKPLPPELLKLVTWLTPNETESRVLLEHLGNGGLDLTKKPDVEQAARVLLEQGPRNVILKLGERGVYLLGQDVPGTHIPPIPVRAVDTTSAGDAFNGAFALALAKRSSPIEAAEFATAVAAISVTRPGAQPSMPTLSEVQALRSKRSSSRQPKTPD